MQPDQLALNLHLDSPLMGKAKNDRNLMVYAWFGLNREKQTELPVYDDGKVRIEVTGTKHGVANIWDAELLIYLASIIQERINLGMVPEPLVSFAAHDFFRICCATIKTPRPVTICHTSDGGAGFGGQAGVKPEAVRGGGPKGQALRRFDCQTS